ncbi:MAG: hypothetical protein HZA67_07675 [Rhodospirillales bacterium]|jgi:hypothetical protein|nr:hypothetical protein [Rhodospirillales bacterium]
MNRLRWMMSGARIPGAGNVEEAEEAGQPSSLREALFPVGIFASWWLLYFY